MSFDAYRDVDARKAMVAYVMASRRIDERTALDELRRLNHVGLAYVHRDAMAQCTHRVNYDPCEVGR